MTTFGVHSEVGRLRKVMVHRPELSLQRLTPTTHDDLLFDDVLWVERAQYEHDQFVAKMRERGVEVFLLRDLLGEALAASDEARRKLIELAASEFTVGISHGRRGALRAVGRWPRRRWPGTSIGGLTVAESGLDLGRLRSRSVIAAAVDDESMFVLPPLPNTLFTRDSSCWIYGGVSINPMFWPARRLEAYNVAAIYRYHPMFAEADFEFWYPELGDDDRFNAVDFGRASLEGGDVQPIGNGTVLIGMSERSQARMIEQVARALFAKGGGRARGGGRDDQGPRPHAPRHRVHDARPRRGDGLPAGDGQGAGDQPPPRRERRRVPRHRGEGLPLDGRRRPRRAATCG